MLEQIDRSLLTEDQQLQINVWGGFFSHPGYVQYIERISERQEACAPQWKAASNSRELGYCQGQDSALVFFKNFERLIALEFEQLTGDAQGEEDFDFPEDEEDASLIA